MKVIHQGMRAHQYAGGAGFHRALFHAQCRNILKTKRAIKKGLAYQQEKKGYSS